MHPILSRSLTTWLFCVASSAQQAITPLDGPLPYDENMSRQGDKTYVVRIVDGVTGRPIPKAKLHAVLESRQPDPANARPTRSVTADALGFARMTNPPERAWFFAMANGYGTSAWMGAGALDDNVALLLPGVEVPVLVLDALDRPVVGAEVGFVLGCGHTPNVRTGRTAADGIARLPDINPTRSFGDNDIRDLYPVAPTVDGDYVSLQWLPGDGPYRLRRSPGTVSTGLVVDADGKPLANAWVGMNDMHRGPWTRTNANGEFRLLGRRGLSHFVKVEEVEDKPGVEAELPPTTPITLRIVPEDAEPRPQGQVVLDLRVDDGALPGDVELHATALVHSDDYDGNLEFDVAGKATADLPVGNVVIWGQPGPDYEPIERTVRINSGENQIDITVTRRPKVRVQLGDLPDDVEVDLVTQHEAARDITEPLRNDQAFAVPADQPFGLVMRRGAISHFVPCESVAQAADLQLSWPEAMTIKARILDAEGQPTQAFVHVNKDLEPPDAPEDSPEDWKPNQDDGAVATQTHEQGAVMLHVYPGDANLRPRTVMLEIPEFEPGREIEVGPIALRPAADPMLRCLDPQGRPLSYAKLLRPGLTLDGDLAEDGGWDLIDPRANDTILLDLAEFDDEKFAYVTYRQQLQGQGPWVVRVPTGSARLTFVDTENQPLEGVTLCVGDQTFADLPETFELRGLPAGKHRLAVGHPDRAACNVVVEIADQPVDVTVPVPAR